MTRAEYHGHHPECPKCDADEAYFSHVEDHERGDITARYLPASCGDECMKLWRARGDVQHLYIEKREVRL